ncbi:hypothetical protein [Microbacterium sp. NPDC056569]|uniref:hypothetical protein n=1 Tax=Microbacterium sp. NPDC056569 TaxID=3345867 RepID=UPI00366EA914
MPDEGAAAREARLLRAAILRLARAYKTIAPSHAFLWSVTAAVIWKFPLPLRLLRAEPISGTDAATSSSTGTAAVRPRRLDVGVFHPHRSSKAAGVRARQFRATVTAVTQRDGFRVTDAATTWAHLAELLTVDELIAVGDAIVRVPRARGMRRGKPSDAHAGLADLEAVAAQPRPGAARLREALSYVRVGSSSARETEMRLALTRAGLPEPELDVDVIASDGTPIGYTELAYSKYRVLIEYEGDHHRSDPAQWERDIVKHAACAAEGWEVVRITSAQMKPTPAVAVSRVRAALVRAAWGR